MGLQRGFALFANDVLQQEFEQLAFHIEGTAAGLTDYALTLPSYHAVDLVEMTVAPGHTLHALVPDARPSYLAFGDSITHGLGQQSASHLSYIRLLNCARRRLIASTVAARLATASCICCMAPP
jgi:hypothetical protein